MDFDKKIAFVIFGFFLIFFVLSSDGHRYTIDEDMAAQQSKRIVTQQIPLEFVPGETHLYYDYPYFKNPKTAPICYDGILCSGTPIGYSLTQIPFISLNYIFQFVNDDTIVWSTDDFSDTHYVFWRNSLDSDFTFLELFYGPFFSSLIICIFYLTCRSFNFQIKSSILVSGILAFSTLIWAYSQTSLNVVPLTFFMLLGFFFIKKFLNSHNVSALLFSGLSLGFGFLVRNDAILFIFPLSALLVWYVIKKKQIKKIIPYFSSIFGFYLIYLAVNYLRFHVSPFITTEKSVGYLSNIGSGSTPVGEGLFGLLFSPGVGLFIFVPIILTIFFSFPNFFKQHKLECISIVSIFIFILIYYSTSISWHGLVSWGPRYLYSIIPFLILPLAAAIENKNFSIKIASIILAGIGFFFNLVYIVNDIHWFVWGQINHSGLFGIDRQIDGIKDHLNIDPTIIWTFQYSQLTHSIDLFFNNTQFDLFFLKLFGNEIFILSVIGIFVIFFVVLRFLFFNKKIPQ